jgi:BirA family biotin operon repressor/biotin-[acetyl-CoA-carboxylase] ligase
VLIEIEASQRVLIALFADGQFHSGAELGRQLGISRAAVWKQLQKLSPLGLSLLSVKGKGYCLSRPLELLCKNAITGALNANARLMMGELDILLAVNSTNDYAMTRLASAEVGRGYVCMAEFQGGGRGRRGRQWVSPFGCNIYLSLVWEFEAGAAALEGLSLAVGVAVAKALESQGVSGVCLKWPNDILLDGAKLGGILLEMTGDPAGRCQVVVGVGINVDMPAGQSAIDQPWVAATSVAPDLSRNRLSAALLNEIISVLSHYSDTGFVPYREAWQQLDAYKGCAVKVIAGDRVTSGNVLGVADNGALLLDVNGVEQAMYGGELSLRLDSDS